MTFCFSKAWKNYLQVVFLNGEKCSVVLRVHLLVVRSQTKLWKLQAGWNKAFVGLRSCNYVQTERSIFKYANWPRLQVKRTGPSSWSVQLVRPAGPSSWSVQLVCLEDPFSWSVHAHCTMHVAFGTLHFARCILHVARGTWHVELCTVHLTHCINLWDVY